MSTRSAGRFALMFSSLLSVAACGSEAPNTEANASGSPAASAAGSAGHGASAVPGAQGSESGSNVSTSQATPAGSASMATGPTAGVNTAGASTMANPAQAAASAGVPCDISQLLQTHCGECHGASPLNGAPMPLVSYADLTAPAHSDTSRKVYDVVAARVEDRARPMPPDPTKRLPDQDIARLSSWAMGGAQAGESCAPAAAEGGTSATNEPASGGVMEAINEDVSADIEECYELRAHGSATPGDSTPYTVAAGEMYTTFIFKAPWTKPVQGLRFRHLPDNATVLHHWLLYSESANVADGAIEPCDLNGPTGFLCGSAESRGLITGWAPGRKDFALPKDVGLELPGPGELLAVEFHYYNNSGADALDQSGVEVCVTSQFRENTASVSWLGTETINVPAKSEGTAAGTCTPQRMGMNDTDPIHVLYSWPHMHKTGNHLTSIVNRVDGGSEVMYDGEFNFEYQVLYDSPMLLYPGDTVTTTCTFENTNDFEINFGASTTMEMCFNFTYAWPAHALDNPGGALLSSTNSCFH